MRSRRDRRRCWRGLRLGLLDIDTAFEQGAVFDADTRGNDVSHKLRILTDINLVRGLHVALHLPEDDDLPGPNAGLNTTVRPDRYFILLRFDRSFDIAIDIEVFLREDLADDFD